MPHPARWQNEVSERMVVCFRQLFVSGNRVLWKGLVVNGLYGERLVSPELRNVMLF